MEPRKGLGWTIWGLSALQLLDGLRQTHTICESNAASEKTVFKNVWHGAVAAPRGIHVFM